MSYHCTRTTSWMTVCRQTIKAAEKVNLGQNTLSGVIVNTLKTPSPLSIDRALGLLELPAQSHHGLTLAEVTERMGIPRSSAPWARFCWPGFRRMKCGEC